MEELEDDPDLQSLVEEEVLDTARELLSEAGDRLRLPVDLVVADRFLSRKHARLFQRDGRLFVEDLGSRNGTQVNGIQIHVCCGFLDDMRGQVIIEVLLVEVIVLVPLPNTLLDMPL